MWHLSRDPQWPHSIFYGLSAYYNIEFVMILNFFDCILKVSASNVSKIPILIFKPVNHNLTITSFYRRIFKQYTTWINLNFLFLAFRDGLYPKGKFQIKWIYIRVNKCISEQHLIVDLIFQLSQRDYILISIFPFSLMGWRICVVKKSFRIAFSII